jgi:DNA-binding Lrp family transcriptional regulator
MKLPFNFLSNKREHKLDHSIEQIAEMHFFGQKGRIPKWHYFGPVSITEIRGNEVYKIKHRNKQVDPKPKDPIVNKEEEDEVLRLYQAELPKGEIARQIGLTVPEVRRILRKKLNKDKPKEEKEEPNKDPSYLGNFEVKKEDENETIRVYYLRKARGLVPKTILTINQDLLAECEQVPFRQTVEGSRKSHHFEIAMLLLASLSLDVVSLFLSFSGPSGVAASRAAISYVYEPVAFLVGFSVVGYIMHKFLLDKTYPKYIVLRDLPGQPTGKEIATPVMLLNSQLEHPVVYVQNISDNYNADRIKEVSQVLASYDETQQATLRTQNQMLEFDYHALELKTEKMSLEKQNLELTYPQTMQSRIWKIMFFVLALALGISIFVNLGA